MQYGDIVALGAGCVSTNDGLHHCEDYCRMCGGQAGLVELKASHAELLEACEVALSELEAHESRWDVRKLLVDAIAKATP